MKRVGAGCAARPAIARRCGYVQARAGAVGEPAFAAGLANTSRADEPRRAEGAARAAVGGIARRVTALIAARGQGTRAAHSTLASAAHACAARGIRTVRAACSAVFRVALEIHTHAAAGRIAFGANEVARAICAYTRAMGGRGAGCFTAATVFCVRIQPAATAVAAGLAVAARRGLSRLPRLPRRFGLSCLAALACKLAGSDAFHGRDIAPIAGAAILSRVAGLVVQARADAVRATPAQPPRRE